MARGLWAIPLLLCAAVVRAETAVTTDGTVLRGPVAVQEARRVAKVGAEERPLSSLLLVEREDGTLVWAPDLESRVAGYRTLVGERIREEMPDLIKEAVRARDKLAARRIFDWAKEYRLDAKDERVLGKKVAELEGKNLKPVAEAQAEVLAREASMRKLLPDLILARMAREPEGSEGALRLLRAALRESPGHEGALAELAKRSPGGDARAWLDWRLDLETRGFQRLPEDSKELLSVRHYWHPDVVASTSADFVLYTPLRDAEIEKSVLLRAWLVIGELKRLFATDKPKVRRSEPLDIRLYGNEKSLRTDAGYEVIAEVPPFWQWRHGRCEVTADLTRLLAPAAPEHRPLFERTLVHEVARHWLWSKCPRYGTTEIMSAPDVAGHWVEAGLLSLLAEGRFDLVKGILDLSPRLTPSLKTVREQAAITDPKRGGLIPWKEFFLMDRDDAAALWEKDWFEGQVQPSVLFGMQAAAVAHYLFHADMGARRPALLDYYVRQRIGEQAALAPQVAFGLSADALGAAVVAHCKGVQ